MKFVICLVLLVVPAFSGCASERPKTDGETIQYIQLTTSDPKQLAAMVSTFFPVRASSVDHQRVVVVAGSPDAVEQAMKMIDKIEFIIDDSELFPKHVIFIRHLQNARTEVLTPLLNDLAGNGFFQITADTTPTAFVANDRTNSVLISTDREAEDKIRALIDELDKPVETK